ncbi:MAG: type III-A CRISPR-associated protein Csm2 [Meiothermus sp.]|uniref:type III-A CRISPR-associated protein Csm2 n=1 Tax=Meiothermus sp. TaxID=1955249 RepID=UPI0025F710EB|nr:type III-A CRISPR-associated protein Csm2 [Meiothermus sp.]MCS7069834.1 type III-A CRISPR-associated protein Csm2 [Meiothermus sp.]
MEFYQNRESKILRPGLFDSEAKKDADQVQGIQSSQFRNYFHELRALEARFEREAKGNPQVAFAKLIPQLELLKAKLAYGQRKNGPLQNAGGFVNLMNRLIDAGKRSPEDFEAMMQYLEAVLAYFYAKEGQNQGGRR